MLILKNLETSERDMSFLIFIHGVLQRHFHGESLKTFRPIWLSAQYSFLTVVFIQILTRCCINCKCDKGGWSRDGVNGWGKNEALSPLDTFSADVLFPLCI